MPHLISDYEAAHGHAACAAKYGRRDWLSWFDRNGDKQSAPKTTNSIKKAMLDTGTQGTFILLTAGNGHGMIITWRMAVTVWRNSRVGY